MFLASTATYMAYANYRVMNRSNLYEMYLGQLPELVESDLFLNTRPEYGDSLYALHNDGSGMSIGTRLRPIVNMRPNTTLSAFNDDGWIWGWLKAASLGCDVITDEDLHNEGLGLLSDYRVVITGNHPEYVSTAMWDALQGFLDRGGRLMYLGGNGFFWRVAFHAEVAGVMELRRAEDGSRPWEAEPGEYYSSFNGEYGGLWRRVGRPPQTLVGVGFTASGFDISSYYRRTAASRDPRAAFIFAGIEDEIIGDFGLAGGGAAGQEIDRFDRAPRVAAARAGRRAIGGPYRGNDGRQGGHAGSQLHHRWSGQPSGSRRHDLLRDRQRRRGLLHRVDRLGGKPALAGLRQQCRAHNPQRFRTLRRRDALSTTCSDRRMVIGEARAS